MAVLLRYNNQHNTISKPVLFSAGFFIPAASVSQFPVIAAERVLVLSILQ